MLNWMLSLSQTFLNQTLLSPVFVGAVAFILICERLLPVNPAQKTFSVGLAHDLVWVMWAIFFRVTVVVFYTKCIRYGYELYLQSLTMEFFQAQPELIRFVVGVLIGDFLSWFQHWLKHWVPWFWQIHAVHHSQKELNLFTDYRFHIVEYFISRPIVILPLLVVGVDDANIAIWAALTTWQARFYHANIKTDFGWLRYIFVTPQSHRIHHSINPQHFDKNFGVIFSFWDRIFRTQYTGYNEYPATGIVDAAFPLEHKNSWQSWVATPLQQLAYPFLILFRK